MSDFDDDIGDLASDLMDEAGDSFDYWRGTTKTVVTMAKSQLPSDYIDDGTGGVTEVQQYNFKCPTSSLPYAIPKQGDRIIGGGETYELNPTTSEKVFRQLSPQMTRLHTKRVA